MRAKVEGQRQAPSEVQSEVQLVEVVAPRTNTAIITPCENLLAAISLREPFALEMAATADARWFLIRTGSREMRRHLEEELGAAYPQAEFRPLDLCRYPHLDPAVLGSDEQVAASALTLRAPQYLPLRMFRDVEVEARQAPQADPVLGILGALGNLPSGWRGFSQLILRPAPDDWSKPYLRYSVQHPLAFERASSAYADTSLTSVYLMGGVLVLLVLGYQGYLWYEASNWLPLGLMALGGATGVPGLFWLGKKVGDKPVYDMRLVQEKVLPIAYVAQARLAVFAPSSVPSSDVQSRLAGLAAAYRQYNLSAGNGFVPVPLKLKGGDLGDLQPRSTHSPSRCPRMVLNTRELAGLWHLPQAGADVQLVERTTARRFLPLPFTFDRGCRIGVSSHQGHSASICLPDDLLRRNALLVAKTRRGKSTLMLRIAHYLMESRSLSPRPALVLVDPHRDLARAALGLVPDSRRDDVVYLDLAEPRRPFGLNLIDAALGWDRDKAVSNCLTVFRNEFDRFWGPRMEDAFRFALLTLFEANSHLLSVTSDGREQQHTILDVPTLLSDAIYRKVILDRVSDPVIHAWWEGYFRKLDPRLQLEIINPVLTKVHRFSGSRVGRSIVGQPCSTIEPARWLREGSIVLVSTASGIVGEDVSSLIGAALVNIVALVASEQARLDPRNRRQITIVADEFHSLPGADYELVLSELSKQGANLILATQSLSRLDVLDREHNRGLKELVFANNDSLFAFQTSAEDARFLSRELGDPVTESDVIELADYHCYARVSVGGRRIPTFSVELDPPLFSDRGRQEELAQASALRFGRDAEGVERELRAARDRVHEIRLTVPESLPRVPGAGVSAETKPRVEDSKPGKGSKGKESNKLDRPRNQHRDHPARKDSQASLPLEASDSETGHPSSDAEVSGGGGSPSEKGDERG